VENCFHSVAINQEIKLEMSSRKLPQRYVYTVYEESGIPSTRTTCKKGETEIGENFLAAHCMADLVTECKRKTLILSGDFRFSAENESFSFRFRSKMEFHFRWHFRLRLKMKNSFQSASSRPIHNKKVLVLRCKVLVLVWNTRLGLGLGLERILKSWS